MTAPEPTPVATHFGVLASIEPVPVIIQQMMLGDGWPFELPRPVVTLFPFRGSVQMRGLIFPLTEKC